VVGTIEDGANGASVASGSSISPGGSNGVSASGTGETSSKNGSAFTWRDGLAADSASYCRRWGLRLCFDHIHLAAISMLKAARVIRSTLRRKGSLVIKVEWVFESDITVAEA